MTDRVQKKRFILSLPLEMVEKIDRLIELNLFSSRAHFFGSITKAFFAECRYHNENIMPMTGQGCLVEYIQKTLGEEKFREIFPKERYKSEEEQPSPVA